MNNIKVTVEYETPKTNAFDTLLAQYENTKKLSIDTINYYKPLAETAELAKLNAILEQLGTIKKYLQQLNAINPKITSVGVEIYRTLVVYVDGKIEWSRVDLSIETYKKYPHRFNNDEDYTFNILGRWDAWEMFKKLEQKCVSALEKEIEKQKENAEKQVNRLKNIVEV